VPEKSLQETVAPLKSVQNRLTAAFRLVWFSVVRWRFAPLRFAPLTLRLVRSSPDRLQPGQEDVAMKIGSSGLIWNEPAWTGGGPVHPSLW
jgi:hypothetical protein